jgi:hypothetical protein
MNRRWRTSCSRHAEPRMSAAPVLGRLGFALEDWCVEGRFELRRYPRMGKRSPHRLMKTPRMGKGCPHGLMLRLTILVDKIIVIISENSIPAREYSERTGSATADLPGKTPATSVYLPNGLAPIVLPSLSRHGPAVGARDHKARGSNAPPSPLESGLGQDDWRRTPRTEKTSWRGFAPRSLRAPVQELPPARRSSAVGPPAFLPNSGARLLGQDHEEARNA